MFGYRWLGCGQAVQFVELGLQQRAGDVSWGRGVERAMDVGVRLQGKRARRRGSRG